MKHTMRLFVALCVAGLMSSAVGVAAQSSTWTPTNESRIEYQWHLDKTVSDNWRCVISFRWVGPEPKGKAYVAKGNVTYERDKAGGGGQLQGRLYLLFTKDKKEADDPKVGCGRVISLTITSVE